MFVFHGVMFCELLLILLGTIWLRPYRLYLFFKLNTCQVTVHLQPYSEWCLR